MPREKFPGWGKRVKARMTRQGSKPVEGTAALMSVIFIIAGMLLFAVFLYLTARFVPLVLPFFVLFVLVGLPIILAFISFSKHRDKK